MLPVIFEIIESWIFWGPILIFLQPTIWSSSNHFKTVHFPAFYHYCCSQDFHETRKDSESPPSSPTFSLISVQLIPAHPSKPSPMFYKSLFSHSYWHAVRFYFDFMLYIRWAIGLSWLSVCIYLSNFTPCVACPRGSTPADMRRLI